MIACYVRGEGLGHLTRLRAALHTLGLDGEPVTVLTDSSFAADPRVTGGWTVLRAPSSTGLADWIAATLADLAADELFIDAFPAGLKGELTAAAIPPGTSVVHLARLLRWDAYRPLLPTDPPRFDRTYMLEPLTPEHDAHLRSVSREVTPLTLVEPPVTGHPSPSAPAAVPGGRFRPGAWPDASTAFLAASGARPPSGTRLPAGVRPAGHGGEPVGPAEAAATLGPGAWLVVHSGPDAEIGELVAYARDLAAVEGLSPRLTLVSPHRPADLPAQIAHLDVYPVWPLFPSAERIITAAGFNAVRQLSPWRDRHRMLPFPRTLDDQFTRAARTRRPA
ncbi:hypothetical protein SAMN04489712_10967 [Thermomonospora echinospora]|uniref:Glycosyl transferase n=1 Tax=Thermomonospora echinospora TaxID=1992 RepID=A0A1H6C8G7_9ACTN|nr:hypothetical protein [Thermomonospora echinospora]SEG69270.1 hypothetical protein SAMN04489712_10967 [Thermomonospora echinospora]